MPLSSLLDYQSSYSIKPNTWDVWPNGEIYRLSPIYFIFISAILNEIFAALYHPQGKLFVI